VSFGSWADATGTVDAGAEVVGFAFNSVQVTGSTPTEETASASEESPEDITRAEIKAKGDINLTAGRDIQVDYLTSKEGSITADAGRSVGVQEATASKNLWVSARLGSLGDVVGDDGWGTVSGKFTAQDGWAYVWAARDISGSVEAKKTVSATAWKDLDATLSSSEYGVEAFVGGDVLKEITGTRWVDLEARGKITAKVTAGDEETWGDVSIRAGGDITAAVTASGNADVATAGDVTANVEGTDGWLDVVANGVIIADLTAGAEATAWAGGLMRGSVTAEQDADVTAGGPISSSVTSRQGNVSVHAGGDLYGSVSAKGNAIVEAAGSILGEDLTITADQDISVVANGNIQGHIRAEGWLADVRSGNGEVNAIVETGHTNLAAPESPTSQRSAVIDSQIAELQQELATTQSFVTRDFINKWIANLQAEKELLSFQVTTDLAHIDPAVIRALVVDGLAKEWNGQIDIGNPGEPDLQQATGYVYLADVVGNQLSYWVFEPRLVTDVELDPLDHNGIRDDKSLVGDPHARNKATYYQTVRHEVVPFSGTVEDALAFARSDFEAQRQIKFVLLRIEANRLDRFIDVLDGVHAGLNFAFHLIPLVGAVENFINGDYLEAGLSLASDAAMFLGIGAAFKASKCVYSGRQMVKVAAGIDLGVAGFRLGQAAAAIANNEPGRALGYLGDATLRLLGLSATSIAWLRNKNKCFVAGTPVHTADGQKPIEQIRQGEQVWAFDRQHEEWQLHRVTQTFVSAARGPLATVVLSNGDTLTGTDGHAVWAVEGEDLTSRPSPTHGADDPAGRTPGRWVGLGTLREGDVVLTRQGRTARVTSVQTFRASELVYNLEVEGLHCYAVGSGGLLAHNGPGPDPCHLGSAMDAAKGTAAVPEKPVVKAPEAAKAPEPSKAGGVTPEKVEPASATLKPTTEKSNVPWTVTEDSAPAFHRKPQLPQGGTWKNADGSPGVPGESFYHSGDLPPVRYQGQFPVFEPLEGVAPKIRMTGVRTDQTDFRRADEAFAEMLKGNSELQKKLGVRSL
jgi:hypothetical protein